MNFSSVIFTSKCYGTQDGPDEWAKCYISSYHSSPVRVRHQQGRHVIDGGSIRPFRIENGVKIDSQSYYAFLNKHFLPW